MTTLSEQERQTLEAVSEFTDRLDAAVNKTPFTCTPERLAAAQIALLQLRAIIDRLSSPAPEATSQPEAEVADGDKC